MGTGVPRERQGHALGGVRGAISGEGHVGAITPRTRRGGVAAPAWGGGRDERRRGHRIGEPPERDARRGWQVRHPVDHRPRRRSRRDVRQGPVEVVNGGSAGSATYSGSLHSGTAVSPGVSSPPAPGPRRAARPARRPARARAATGRAAPADRGVQPGRRAVEAFAGAVDRAEPHDALRAGRHARGHLVGAPHGREHARASDSRAHLPVRSNRATPSSRSSRLTCRLTADCAMCNRCAANRHPRRRRRGRAPVRRQRVPAPGRRRCVRRRPADPRRRRGRREAPLPRAVQRAVLRARRRAGVPARGTAAVARGRLVIVPLACRTRSARHRATRRRARGPHAGRRAVRLLPAPGPHRARLGRGRRPAVGAGPLRRHFTG